MIRIKDKENNNNGHGQVAEINREANNNGNGNTRERSHSEPHHAVEVHTVEVQHDQVHDEHGQHGNHDQHAEANQDNRSNEMKNEKNTETNNETNNGKIQPIFNNTLAAVVFLFMIIIGSQSIVEAKSININDRIAIDRIERDLIDDVRIENAGINDRIDRIDRIDERIASIEREIIADRIQNGIENEINSDGRIIGRIDENIEIGQRISRIDRANDIVEIINDRIQDRIVSSNNIVERIIS